MKRINYNHLLYFYTVATEGGVNKAAEKLNVSAQTISGQISSMEDYLGYKLFNRIDKKLIPNEMGNVALSYAADIFRLGDQLSRSLGNGQTLTQQVFNVGILDSIPKTLSYDLLKQCYEMELDIRVNVKTGDLEPLLNDFNSNELDLLISDRPVPNLNEVKAHSHLMAESGFTFYAATANDSIDVDDFPNSLDGVNLVLPGKNALHSNLILSWLDSQGVTPNIVGEFEDTALMKMFAQEGYGAFFAPTILNKFILDQYDVKVLGSTNAVREQFYAITPQRSVMHPATQKILDEAKTISQFD